MHATEDGLEPEAAPLVTANELRKSYGATAAVRGISFEVRRGQVVGFLGPNGAGKSTTMKMLTGFLRPSSGSACIGGIDVAQDGILARAQLGYLPENAPLYDDMMVVDFLRFICDVRELDRTMARRRTQLVVERCGLGDVLGKDIGTLSKGYRQRVGLAQALLHDPDLLILDEPTSGLDPNQIVEIRNLITDLGRDKTVLLSTHILSEVQAVCNRAIIIHQGTIVADDAPEALGRDGGATSLVVGLKRRGAQQVDLAVVKAKLGGLRGVVRLDAALRPDATVHVTLAIEAGRDIREDVFDTAIHHGWAIVEMKQQQSSLEDVFRRLTHGGMARTGERHAA